MRLAWPILALVLTVGAAWSQDGSGPAQPTVADASQFCTVEGVVVKATTGEALKRINVTLSPIGTRAGEAQQPINTSTDAGGRFLFSGLLPGRYSLSAEGNGYNRQTYGQLKTTAAGKILTLVPGANEKNLVFRLMPPAVISGTVYDEDGTPIMNAYVQAIRVVRTGAHPQAYPAAGVQTNDLGQYRLYGLEAGRYLVSTGPSSRNDDSDATYLSTYYPGTTDPEQATPIALKPGDEVPGIDLDMTLVHGVHVRGQVVCSGSAKPLQGVYVSLEPRETGMGRFMNARYGGPVRDDKGDFEIRGVPPGSYWMSASWFDGNRSFSGRVPVEVGNSNVESATLTLGLALTLRGRVRALPGGTLNLATLSVWLQPLEGSMGGGGSQVNPDGTFTIENVAEGTYRIRVAGFPEEYYLESARMGGMDVLGPGLNISRNDVASLEVVLSHNGGSLEGTVLRDQAPYGGAVVVLVPDPPNRSREDLYSVKSADPLGRFTMLGLPPGDFKLFAWEPREGLETTDPDFIKDYEGRGVHVHIEAGNHQVVQVTLIPAEENAP